jgi:Mg2+/Co2+ transporter CorC
VPVASSDLGEPVGALVVELLGRLPRAGDKVELARGTTAEVTAIARRRVTHLRVQVHAGPEGAPTEEKDGADPGDKPG